MVSTEKIEQAVVSVFQIYNSGSQPIETEDFKRPLTFVFNEKTQILDEDVINKVPEEIEANLSKQNNRVVLNNTLINPNDRIDVSFITTTKIRPKIDTRIVGVSNVEIDEKGDKSGYIGGLHDMMSAILIGILIGILSIWTFKNDLRKVLVIIFSYIIIYFAFRVLIMIL